MHNYIMYSLLYIFDIIDRDFSDIFINRKHLKPPVASFLSVEKTGLFCAYSKQGHYHVLCRIKFYFALFPARRL